MVSTWAVDLANVGPIYPWQGSELILAIAGVAFWILWHIIQHYSHYGFDEFVIALGYRGEYIKRYMVEYCNLSNNLTVEFENGNVSAHDGPRPK